MHSKRVSVVMATYNGEKYLLEQMESLRNQTYQPDEVMILDDCSSDGTVDLIQNYIVENELINWKLICNKKNQGWKKNFKMGIDLVSGDYIFPCDQDDVWHLNKIEKMVQCMEKYPEIKLLVSNYTILFSEKDTGSKVYASREKKMVNDDSVEILGINPKWPYIVRPGCTFCFRKELYLSIADEWDSQYAHDAILWRYACMDDALGLLKSSLIDFRRHGDNATSGQMRNRQIRIETFKDYIYFHEVALARVENREEKKILQKGIEFLKKRIRLYQTHNIFIWLELAIFYYQYYLTLKGCLADFIFLIKR